MKKDTPAQTPFLKSKTRPNEALQTSARWVRFFDLEGAFQLFLLPEIARYTNALKLCDRELFVAAELVNKHTVNDVVLDGRSTVAKANRHAWYPLAKLQAENVPHLVVNCGDAPSDFGLLDGQVHVSKTLLSVYTLGDDDWLYRDED